MAAQRADFHLMTGNGILELFEFVFIGKQLLWITMIRPRESSTSDFHHLYAKGV